jgi:hypothetical protein
MTHPTISDDVIRDVLQRFPELAVHATEAENIGKRVGVAPCRARIFTCGA